MKKTLGLFLYLTREGDRIALQFVRQGEDTMFVSQPMEKPRARSEAKRLAKIMKLHKGRRADAWHSADVVVGGPAPRK